MAKGLFIGLTTLDLIYLTQTLPLANQKMNALDATVAAGGPATNAAVAFAHYGHTPLLLTVLGGHALASAIRQDLEQQGVTLVDLRPKHCESPPVSSILVTQATGERAVVSLNAQKIVAAVPQNPAHLLRDIDIVLIDGHQLPVSIALAQQAHRQGIPVVLDGGSWKPGLEHLLGWIDYAICSADFRPPGCADLDGTIAYLQQQLQPTAGIAITQGGQPIFYQQGNEQGWVEVASVQAVDTLGAGDIFHGAFCHFILTQGFRVALREAGAIATHTCTFFGTRTWLQVPPK